MRQATCQIAQGKPEGARENLDICAKLAKADSRTYYDTYELAYGFAAIGDYKRALSFAPISKSKRTVTFMEMARLAILLIDGKKEAATKLAKGFDSRLSKNVDLQDDLDPLHIRLIKALSEQSSESRQALIDEWKSHREVLMKRPLENYVAARVMVEVLKKMSSF